MALSHACVSAIVSSSRSTRLSPNWLPSVVATRVATGMNSGDAGILSSARSRVATLPVRSFLGFFAVDRRLDLARRGGLELFAPPLRCGNPILDCLSDRALRVGHRDARPRRDLLG